jgi:hypothetical protein
MNCAAIRAENIVASCTEQADGQIGLEKQDRSSEPETCSFKALSPKERYQQSGLYNPSPCELLDDIERWPDQFDEHDWPLFGNYNPYALMHPLKQVAWYHSPRNPTSNETCTEYLWWFKLAIELDLSWFADLTSWNSDTFAYPRSAVGAFDELSRVEEWVLPRLLELLEVRDASPEFALLWGEYKSSIDGVPDSIKREVIRSKRAKGGSEQEKSAQVKWYLHWKRHHCDELGWSPNRAKKEFVFLVRDLASGKRPVPAGFTREWFKKAVGDHGGLPEVLRRANKNKRAKQLLSDSADAEPRIPPVALGAYDQQSEGPP